MADTPTSAARPMLPEYEDIAEVVTRLEGDAALLRGEYDELERAENMDKAAGLLRALLDANYAVAKLLLEQDRDGAKKWARGLYISMDTQGSLTVSATPVASEVKAVQAQPASAPMGEPIAWLPNSENINALPVPVREYIMHLETICDPAGLVRENAQLRDTNRGLQVMYRNAVDAAAPAQARMPLSEEQIVKIAERYDVRSTVKTYGDEIINFARAVEAAHGVGVRASAVPLTEAQRDGLTVKRDVSIGGVAALKLCASTRDGDCEHANCPQFRDGEPAKTGRHCPLDLNGGNDE